MENLDEVGKNAKSEMIQKKKQMIKIKRVKRTEKGSTKYDDLEIVMSKTFEE